MTGHGVPAPSLGAITATRPLTVTPGIKRPARRGLRRQPHLGGKRSSTVSEIAVATHSVINTVTVGTNPCAVAFDGSHIWVANDNNTVSEIDAATHRVISTVTVGSTSFGIAFDGTHIWVTNFGGATVSIL